MKPAALIVQARDLTCLDIIDTVDKIFCIRSVLQKKWGVCIVAADELFVVTVRCCLVFSLAN
jgi:hypothetical protein